MTQLGHNHVPVGRPPPCGERFFQKMEWLMWPPPLNSMAFCTAITPFSSPTFLIHTYNLYMYKICLQCCASIRKHHNFLDTVGRERAFFCPFALFPLTALQCRLQLLLGRVQILDVGGVVFAVVQLHDLARNDGLQRVGGIRKLGEHVLLSRGGCCRPQRPAGTQQGASGQHLFTLFSSGKESAVLKLMLILLRMRVTPCAN